MKGLFGKALWLLQNLNLKIYKLLLIKITFNKQGPHQEIMPNDNIGSKFKEFGWNVNQVDGHNIKDLIFAISKENNDKPNVIIANTIKGKGIKFLKAIISGIIIYLLKMIIKKH